MVLGFEVWAKHYFYGRDGCGYVGILYSGDGGIKVYSWLAKL